MARTVRGYPALSERALGWLRYLHRKATTPDNWDTDGQPSPMWDAQSNPPVLNRHRFDLIESSYAVALMADVTPAWRELYSEILDQLAWRMTSYWAVKDWLEQIGPDPDRANYPAAWYRIYIPPGLAGHYDTPGWAANGVEPWGLQLDPVGADGNLYYKGFFDLVLGLHLYVSGDEKYNQPFQLVRDGANSYTWTHSRVNQFLAQQWASRPEGVHCENTKIWPF